MKRVKPELTPECIDCLEPTCAGCCHYLFRAWNDPFWPTEDEAEELLGEAFERKCGSKN